MSLRIAACTCSAWIMTTWLTQRSQEGLQDTSTIHVRLIVWLKWWPLREDTKLSSAPIGESKKEKSSAMTISLTLKTTSTRFRVTAERWTAGSGWTERIPGHLSRRLVPGKRRFYTPWGFQTGHFIFCFVTSWRTASGSPGCLGPSGQGSAWAPPGSPGDAEGARLQNGPALLLFLYFFSFCFLFFCCFFFFLVGGFGFVLLISLRRILLGHRADGCPAPGQGLPMNVRLKSPATGDVQSAGHAYGKGQAL